MNPPPSARSAPDTAASEDRSDVVLIIECRQVTPDEYQQVVNALQQSVIPLGLAEKLRMHAAINDCAERVMEAFDGT